MKVMKFGVLAVAIVCIVRADRLRKTRGVGRNYKLFDSFKGLAINVFAGHSKLECIYGLVKNSKENCMQKHVVEDCLFGKVDGLVPKVDFDDARRKVEMLKGFLETVHDNCKDKPDESVEKCAFEEGNVFCEASGFDNNPCFKVVKYFLEKDKEMDDETRGGEIDGTRNGELGDETSDGLFDAARWFDLLRDLSTAIIIKQLNLVDNKELVKQEFEKCKQNIDFTDCILKQVDDIISDLVVQNVPQADMAKAIIKLLAKFITTIRKACSDNSEDDISKCVIEKGKDFCSAQKYNAKSCLRGVMIVSQKIKEMAGEKTVGVDSNNSWLDGLQNIGTVLMSNHFKLQCVKHLVKQGDQMCIKRDDVNECVLETVDAASGPLQPEFPKIDFNAAEAKMKKIDNFLKVVRESCADKSVGDVGKCALIKIHGFCRASGVYKRQTCMKTLLFILRKTKTSAENEKKSFDKLQNRIIKFIGKYFKSDNNVLFTQSVKMCKQNELFVDCVVNTLADFLPSDSDIRVKITALVTFYEASRGACSGKSDKEHINCITKKWKENCNLEKRVCVEALFFGLRNMKDLIKDKKRKFAP